MLKPSVVRLLVPVGAVYAYFVMFPDDLAALLNPLARLLSISSDLSIGAYGLAAVVVLAFAGIRIWGRRDVNA